MPECIDTSLAEVLHHLQKYGQTTMEELVAWLREHNGELIGDPAHTLREVDMVTQSIRSYLQRLCQRH